MKQIINTALFILLVSTMAGCGKPDIVETAEKEDEAVTAIPTSGETVDMNYNVADLKIARDYSQIIIVAVTAKSGATVTMNVKSEDGTWNEIVNTLGVIGYNGLGKTEEGDGKTPVGMFTLSSAFGVMDDPGTALPYIKLDDTDYWVDDTESQYYNRFVSTNEVTQDWSSAEHLADETQAYAYAIPVDYNTDCEKGAGSAIFLHCFSGGATSGCIAIPEENMVSILQNIKKGCVILIDDAANINSY